MDKREASVAGILLVALAALIAWRYGWFEREDPAVAEIRELAAEPRSRDAMRTAFETQTKGMDAQQRFAFFEKMAPVIMPLMAQQFERRYDEFATLSPDEQTKKLDEEIDRMRDRMKKGGPGGPGPGAGRPPISQAKAEEFQKKMLDWTTPTQRAKFEDGMRMMRDRMTQRGFDPPQGPGGGFF